MVPLPSPVPTSMMQMGDLPGWIRVLATVINSESESDAGWTWPGQGDAGGSRHVISGTKVKHSIHRREGGVRNFMIRLVVPGCVLYCTGVIFS